MKKKMEMYKKQKNRAKILITVYLIIMIITTLFNGYLLIYLYSFVPNLLYYIPILIIDLFIYTNIMKALSNLKLVWTRYAYKMQMRINRLEELSNSKADKYFRNLYNIEK